MVAAGQHARTSWASPGTVRALRLGWFLRATGPQRVIADICSGGMRTPNLRRAKRCEFLASAGWRVTAMPMRVEGVWRSASEGAPPQVCSGPACDRPPPLWQDEEGVALVDPAILRDPGAKLTMGDVLSVATGMQGRRPNDRPHARSRSRSCAPRRVCRHSRHDEGLHSVFDARSRLKMREHLQRGFVLSGARGEIRAEVGAHRSCGRMCSLMRPSDRLCMLRDSHFGSSESPKRL